MYYGMSTQIGKAETKEFITLHIKPGSKILDVGAGGGTYYNLLGPYYEWTAVEIWHDSAEYLKQFYDYVYETDIRIFNYPQYYDLIIFGDILEHLSVEDAQFVLNEAEHHANAIIISVPYQYKQGEIYNNKAEIHIQDDLTEQLFDERYPGYTRFFIYNNCAYYWKKLKHEYN